MKEYNFEEIIKNSNAEMRRLKSRADSLERELGQRNSHIAHLVDTLMKIEEKWKIAVTRGHKLQLEINKLKKQQND